MVNKNWCIAWRINNPDGSVDDQGTLEAKSFEKLQADLKKLYRDRVQGTDRSLWHPTFADSPTQTGAREISHE